MKDKTYYISKQNTQNSAMNIFYVGKILYHYICQSINYMTHDLMAQIF